MIEKRRRIVVDTNVFVSASIFPNSRPRLALSHAFKFDTVLISNETLQELRDVLERPKFNRFNTLAARQEFLSFCLGLFGPVVPYGVSYPVFDSRDPKDNKFLGLALAGHADLIITGDDDLLSLHPWRGIPILTPSAYLARHL